MVWNGWISEFYVSMSQFQTNISVTVRAFYLKVSPFYYQKKISFEFIPEGFVESVSMSLLVEYFLEEYFVSCRVCVAYLLSLIYVVFIEPLYAIDFGKVSFHVEKRSHHLCQPHLYVVLINLISTGRDMIRSRQTVL